MVDSLARFRMPPHCLSNDPDLNSPWTIGLWKCRMGLFLSFLSGFPLNFKKFIKVLFIDVMNTENISLRGVVQTWCNLQTHFRDVFLFF